MGDSVRVRVLQFDWFVCAFGRVPASSSITGSESPDHAAAMKDRMQQKMGDKYRFFWGGGFRLFFLRDHTHMHTYRCGCLKGVYHWRRRGKGG